MVRPPAFRLAALALLTLSIAAPAMAQSAPTANRPDPIDASAAVPPLVYRSPFGARLAPPSAPAIGWKAANDTAARIGGWRAYAREAAAPDAPAAAPAAAPPPGAASAPRGPGNQGGHNGHRMP